VATAEAGGGGGANWGGGGGVNPDVGGEVVTTLLLFACCCMEGADAECWRGTKSGGGGGGANEGGGGIVFGDAAVVGEAPLAAAGDSLVLVPGTECWVSNCGLMSIPLLRLRLLGEMMPVLSA
jgi:hypothetical protein